VRILLVDDDASIAELLADACVSQGHEVVSCTVPAAALEYLNEQPVDLLVADIVMPGITGLSLISQARRLQPAMIALAITGHTSRYSVDDVLAAGAFDVIFKPFRLQELDARLQLVEERRQIVEEMRLRRRMLQKTA